MGADRTPEERERLSSLKPVVGGWLEKSLQEAEAAVAAWPEWKRALGQQLDRRAAAGYPVLIAPKGEK